MVEQTVSFWWFAGATFLPVIALAIAEILIYFKENCWANNILNKKIFFKASCPSSARSTKSSSLSRKNNIKRNIASTSSK